MAPDPPPPPQKKGGKTIIEIKLEIGLGVGGRSKILVVYIFWVLNFKI